MERQEEEEKEENQEAKKNEQKKGVKIAPIIVSEKSEWMELSKKLAQEKTNNMNSGVVCNRRRLYKIKPATTKKEHRIPYVPLEVGEISNGGGTTRSI